MSIPRLTRVLVPLAIIVIGASGSLWLKSTRPEVTPAARTEKSWAVSTVRAVPGTHAPVLPLIGRVESPRHATLGTAVAAEVTAVHVLEGETVEPGQLLVELDDLDYRLVVAQREADVAEIDSQLETAALKHEADEDALGRERSLLELARRGVKRARDLQTRNVGTDAGVDQSKELLERQRLSLVQRQLAIGTYDAEVAGLDARRARQQALLDRARRDLAHTRIQAPFAGRLTEVSVAPGDRLKVGDPILRIHDLRGLEIRAQVPTSYQATIAEALAGGRRLTGEGSVSGARFAVSLRRLAAQAGRGNGGVDALLRVEAAPPWLPIGQTVALSIRLPEVKDSFVLPSQALYRNTKVFRVVDNRMQAVVVQKLGETTDPALGGSALIVRGPDLREGDEIVGTQLPNAMEGLRVRPTDES